MSNGSGEKRSPWAWAGCGCAIIAFLGIAAIAVPIGLGWRAVKTMQDPEAVAEKARDLLALESMPEGYRTELALSVPFIGEVVALTSDDRRFLYLRGARLGKDPELLDSGEIGLRELLRSGNVRMSRADEIDSGAFDVDSLRVNWMAVLGDAGIDGLVVDSDDGDSRRDHGRAELTSLMLLRCPDDKGRRARIAIWSGELPDGEAGGEEAAYGGTVVDPDEMREFLAGFALCQSS